MQRLVRTLMLATLLVIIAATMATTMAKTGADKSAIFWVEPYGNLTSVAAYQTAWRQFGQNRRPGWV